MTLINYLKNLWKRLTRRQKVNQIEWVQSRHDIPDNIGKNLFIVGHSNPKWVVMKCPCGCGERLDVNLMKSHHPHWNISYQSEKISLYPSIWLSEDKCGSHFWLKKNKIIWID